MIGGVVFLDLKKGFDTVDHSILLSKLERCGVRGTALQWFQSYLYERKQICRINNTVSGEIEIRCCVPQGSNLGTTMASTFADDTNLSCSGQTSADIEYKINKDLDNIPEVDNK